MLPYRRLENRKSNKHSLPQCVPQISIIVLQVTSVNVTSSVVYYNRGFSTVTGSKCDCSGHMGPCPFLQLVKKDISNEYETVIQERQVALSWQPIPLVSNCELTQLDRLAPSVCKCVCSDLFPDDAEYQILLFDSHNIKACKGWLKLYTIDHQGKC